MPDHPIRRSGLRVHSFIFVTVILWSQKTWLFSSIVLVIYFVYFEFQTRGHLVAPLCALLYIVQVAMTRLPTLCKEYCFA